MTDNTKMSDKLFWKSPLQKVADKMAEEHTEKTGEPCKGIIVSWAGRLMPMVNNLQYEDVRETEK